MATETHRITMGGNDIELPKWATEETLQKVETLIAESGIVTALVTKYMEQSSIDLSQLESDIISHTNRSVAGSAKVDAAKKASFDKKIIGAASSTKNVVDKFSNTDAPLTAMVDMIGDMGSAISGGAADMAGDMDKTKGAGKLISAGGKGIKAFGAGGIAWAAFQAGQIEQFAKAQETMINSGAIMFDDVSPYETLKKSAIESGLSYTELSKVVSQNGIALQSLGNGVSGGTTAFTSMFKSVNRTGDKFGDYGLRSAEMAEVLADYINIQRMTMSKDMALLSTQDDVESGFHNLMIETTALASLTGQNRSEILQKQMASLAQPQVAAALATMDAAGGGHAEVARSFIAQFALLEGSMGPIGKDISDKFNDYIFRVADSPEDFDLKIALGDLAGPMERANNGMIDRINDVFRSGDIEGAKKLLVKEMAKMREAEVGSSMAAAGSFESVVQQMKAGGTQVHLQMKKMAKMSNEEYAIYLKEIERKSKVSGQMTVAMNNMKVSFMEIQNAFVMNLDKASEYAEKLSVKLKEGANKLSGFVESTTTKTVAIADATSALIDNDDVSVNQTMLYSLTAGLVALNSDGTNKKTQNPLTSLLEMIGLGGDDDVASTTPNNKPADDTEETITYTDERSPRSIKNQQKKLDRKAKKEAEAVVYNAINAANAAAAATTTTPVTGNIKTKTPEVVTNSNNSNNSDNNMSLQLDDILNTKQESLAFLDLMKTAMTSIQRSKDYQNAVRNLA